MDIAAAPARVWTVLCGPLLLPLWAGADARLQPRKGGRWSVTVAPGLQREALVDVFEPPRRLRLIYLMPAELPAFDGAVVDDILLEADGPGTIVRLLCSGVPELAGWTPYHARVRALSERSLARLKLLCEKRERVPAS